MELVHRELKSGKTAPLLARCRNADQTASEYVVKLTNAFDTKVEGARFEYLGAAFAHHFGLRAPQPVVVTVSRELVDAVRPSQPDIARRLEKDVGDNFGTLYLPSASTTLPDEPPNSNALDCACQVIAFDALLENADRGPGKVNLLVVENEYVVIDHEMSFSFIYSLLKGRPWPERLAKLVPQHPLYRAVKGKTLQLEGFQKRLAALTEEEVCGFCDTSPVGFGLETRDQVCNHIAEAREEPAPFLAALQELLR